MDRKPVELTDEQMATAYQEAWDATYLRTKSMGDAEIAAVRAIATAATRKALRWASSEAEKKHERLAKLGAQNEAHELMDMGERIRKEIPDA